MEEIVAQYTSKDQEKLGKNHSHAMGKPTKTTARPWENRNLNTCMRMHVDATTTLSIIISVDKSYFT
jgi:hypothetical protein